MALACALAFAPGLAGTAGDPSLGGDKHYARANARPQNGTGADQGTYLPPLAGPQSEITGTVTAQEAGPTGFYVATVTDNGATQYYRSTTDTRGHFHLRLPKVTGLAKLLLFREFDKDGRPDQGASCLIGHQAHLENTEAVLNPPRIGPAIVEANTAYERGGFGQGLVQLHTRGTDALTSKVLLDGSDRGVDTLAASDSSMVGKLHDDVSLGRHRIGAQSGNQRTNEQLADVVTEHFDPIGALRPGQVSTVRLHIDGLGSDPARVRFTIGGAASVADGSDTATTPVVHDTAQVDIRAKEPGQLIVRTILLVSIPEIISKLPGGGIKLNVTPPPTEPPTPTPFPYTTTKPYGPGYVPPTCHPRADGYFEPSQGVWQDDSRFDDHPTKQITRPNRDVPHYNAELDMISFRDTVLVGVEHYRDKNGAEVRAWSHDHIRMNVVSDCSDPPKDVYMRFTLERGASPPGRIIYTSPVLAKIPLTGHRAPERSYFVFLDSDHGIPPPPLPPFRIPAFGEYLVKDELWSADGPTGLAMTVGGNVHGTHSLKVAFLAAFLLPTTDEEKKALDDESESLGIETGKYTPDYFPMQPHSFEGWALDPIDLSGTNIMNPTTEKYPWPGITEEAIAQHATFARSDRVDAELTRQLDALARTAGYERFVVVLSRPDFEAIIGPRSVGLAESKKLIYIRSGENYFTVMHELAHTLSYVWSSGEMTRDCSAPGDYHNKPVSWANGIRIDIAGAPGERRLFHSDYTIMGGNDASPLHTWIAQCTYWNLAKELRKKPDPPALLVRGIASRKGGVPGAIIWPFYDIDGVIDEQPRAAHSGEHWSFVYGGAGGRVLASFPFEPQWADENGRVRDVVSFSFQLPRMAGLSNIELHGPNGLLLRRAVSTQAPSVEISRPLISGVSARVSWTAKVEAGFQQASTVLYSNDSGRSYRPRVFEQPVTSATIKIDPTARHQRIKVIVTDGARSAERTLDF